MNLKFEISFSRIKTFLFYAALFFLTIAVSIKYNGIDYDLWARLIMGNHVFHTGRPMFHEIFSYTPTHIWYDPEWITSGVIYAIQKYFGAAGLTFIKGIGVYLIFVSIIAAIKERKPSQTPYNIGYYLLLTLIMVESSIIFYSVRCQLVTFFLTGFWILLLEKIKNGKNIYLYFLPFIMILWLNCHGGSIAGVGILFLYGIGEFLNNNEWKKYFVALFFVCLAFLINPWGLDYIKFMIESSYLDRSWISEWQSPLNTPFFLHIIYKILLVGGLVTYIYKIWIKKITFSTANKTKILLLLVLAALSGKYVKHIGIFVVVYSIFLYDDFFLLFNNLMEKLRKYLQITKPAAACISYLKEIIIYISIYVYSFFVFMTIPITSSHLNHMANTFPVNPMHFLKVNDIKGKLFTDFYFGSYAAYKGYPDLKIYMDGREEQVYSSELFDESMFFTNWIGDYPDALLKKNPPDIILLEFTSPCLKHLEQNNDYVEIYMDTVYKIFVKKSKQKFNYIQEPLGYSDLEKTLFETNIDFSKTKRKDVVK